MTIPEAQNAARIRDNLARVRERVAVAAARAGRQNGLQVLIIGVTKYVQPPIARLAHEAGLEHLGESRPQELWNKAAALADAKPFWHLIGHLQRNKVRRTLPLVT